MAVEHRRGLCGVCPAGCWVEAQLDDGRLIGLEPDPGHPLGMLCRRGEHAAEITYSPDRVLHPLERSGPKGTHGFRPVGWERGYEVLVGKLREIARESGPEAVAIYTGRGAFELSLCDMFQPAGVAVSSASSVLFPFGSPNTMGVGALCYVSFAMLAPHVTLGRMLVDMFSDVENAELLVVWGANPATDSPPLDMRRLEAAVARGARVVVIDPRRTETAHRTGAQWVPIRPGTDGALALSLIGVLLEEDLHDEGFATRFCHGFDELASYVGHFRPEVTERITGVPAETIRTLARDVARAAGACPLMYTGLEYSDGGLQAIRAVLTLFALAGQLDVPGGIGLAMKGTHFPVNRSCNAANPDLRRAVAFDRFPLYSRYRGEGHASGLVTSVLEGRPYRIRGLVIHGASLLTSWPQTPLWRRTLQGLDFVCCIDRQLTADAAYADLVLPATTLHEIDSYMVYGPLFRLREKLIEPLGEARNDYLIMAELARRLGYGERWPQTEEEMIRHALDGSGFSLEQVRAAGGSVRIPAPMMEYRKWEKGGLRPDGAPGFDTPTGKFEIRSTVLEEYGYEPLPRYVEPREGPLADPALARRFPLVFNSGARPQTDFRSQHHGVPGLVKDHPEPTVDLNPEDAKARGIGHGDLVEVSTARGAVRFRARVTPDIVRGAVECSMGGGTAVGPAEWRERNVNELTDLSLRDEISGFPVYKALLCEVARVDAAARPPGPEAAPTPIASAPAPRARRIYLDNNASTGLAPGARAVMAACLEPGTGNPSSLHAPGREARARIEEARRQLARLANCPPRRLVFTGGGSEADNLALKGFAFAHRGGRDHLVTSAIEHPAILGSCRFLEREGFRVTYLGVDGDGRVSPRALEEALTDRTLLVSVMAANNEVGTLQPIAELCEVAHRHGAAFHTDAVQAAGKVPIDVEALGVDLLSLSAHKFHGPKGVGALFVKKGVSLEPLVHGGHQEGGLRAGTENVAAIAGMGKAAELALASLAGMAKVAALRDRLEAGIRALVKGARLNGHPTLRLPNTLNLTLPGLRGESLVVALDQRGIALSSGSACKTGQPEPTHVLIAMGRSAEEAHCAVRFSLSDENTAADVDETLAALAQVLVELETTVRFLPCK